MSKYALSFTTQGNDLNTYYLAASVLGMVAAKYSTSTTYVNSSYGFVSATYASQFQGFIDSVIESKYWTTNVKCYTAAKLYSSASISNNVTKTAQSVANVTTGGTTSSTSLSGLASWFIGSASNSSWSSVVNQSVPYINYKISCMSETDYKAFLTAIINAGGLADYEQTNSPVQA